MKDFYQCLEKKVIPKGLELNFNLTLSSGNAELQRVCKQHLFTASFELLKEIHAVAKEELLGLMGNLGQVRIEATKDLGREAAESLIARVRLKISKLKINLVRKEKIKLGKVVKLDVRNTNNDLDSIPLDSIRSDQPIPKKRTRRFDRKIRSNRRRSSGISSSAAQDVNPDIVKEMDLDPINLTEVSLTDIQKDVLRKGPKFCPAPKDVNWM